MSSGIRLQDRDIELLKKIIDFNGLPGPQIVEIFFNESVYGYKRLKQLQDNGYLKQVYYYAQNKKNNRLFAQRISAIYYATSKTLRELGYTIDPRYVVPKEDRLDVANLVGNLLARIPSLISKRQAIEKYSLKNFMPVSCVVPNDNPIFIYVLGNKIGRYDLGKIAGFIKSEVIPGAKHFIISRKFREKLFLQNAYFIPWSFATEYLPNIVNDHNFYIKEFLSITKKQFPGIKFLSYQEPLFKAEYNGEILHIGELISGNNQLRLILEEPPENTYIYAPSRKHFYGVRLKQGSFLFYSKKDKQIFKMYSKNNRMYSIPHVFDIN